MLSGALPPGPPQRLCHGPIGGITAAPKPPAENGVPQKTLDTSLTLLIFSFGV